MKNILLWAVTFVVWYVVILVANHLFGFESAVLGALAVIIANQETKGDLF